VTDDQGAKASTTKQVTVTAPTTTHLAADGFGRTVAAGLGTADIGGAWTVAGGASSFAVGSGTAGFSTAKGITLSGYLNSVSSSSSDVTTTIVVPALPAGGTLYSGVVTRRVGSDDYSARVTVTAAGAVTVQVLHGGTSLRSATLSGVTAAAGTVLHLRSVATGVGTTTLEARAWLDGTTQPSAWQVTSTDATAALQAAGSVGLRTYLSSAVTNGPLVVRFGDFTANPAN